MVFANSVKTYNYIVNYLVVLHKECIFAMCFS